MTRRSPRTSLLVGVVASLIASGAVALAAQEPAYAADCTPAQVISNGGFESGSTGWTATSGVIGAASGQSAHGGTSFAWLDGYGSTHTDTLAQTVTLPAGCTSATLSYWLHIDTAETTTTTAFDTLTVAARHHHVASYSNLNKATGYAQRTVDLSSVRRADGDAEVHRHRGRQRADQLRRSTTSRSTSPAAPPARARWSPRPAAQTWTAGSPVNLPIAATDPQGDTLSWTATGLPAGVSIATGTGVVSGTPSAAGSGSATVTARDPGANTGSATFAWTVNPTGGTDRPAPPATRRTPST